VLERNEKGHFLSSGKSAGPKKPAVKKTQAEIIATIRKKVEIKLRKDAKATLGDYIRLLQLQKDLEDADLREIKVTWVEPAKTESEPGK
jgi:hypothetical protein